MDSDDATGEMTLAFSLSALGRLADPAAAFGDAETWCRHIGVVDNDREGLEAAVADHDLRQEFDLADDEDIWLAMERIRASTATPRHVYVGATAADRRVAIQLGWEFVHVTDAAEKAGWRLDGEASTDGLFAGFRERVATWLSEIGDD
ncbi:MULTISPECIES: DUF7124 domain-containing protein [Halolamina]|uniref:DUF7124 domain-containing protein n=1 Tax=Halolamina pelagica TaxID=699431 RepID=A0A1I5N0W6_9EURY|nr:MULTISPECIES: hypothetical protein [Halolamina]NHX36254.1 hypothetical protein [Halolamina sp. R1-12]SFP15434.1 hypothetical protein SAMN05216277_101502 [Halolamina pelagica]